MMLPIRKASARHHSSKVAIDTASTRHHSKLDSAGAGHLNKLEEHHNRIGELRSNGQVTAEHTWASKELLEVIEAMPYHELFIHSLEELMPRGLGS
uniref:Uncharacterized protein n=1 Tax=Quercus lobata TaxID=97700 RepID=A0A7N2KUK3_QUELO